MKYFLELAPSTATSANATNTDLTFSFVLPNIQGRRRRIRFTPIGLYSVCNSNVDLQLRVYPKRKMLPLNWTVSAQPVSALLLIYNHKSAAVMFPFAENSPQWEQDDENNGTFTLEFITSTIGAFTPYTTAISAWTLVMSAEEVHA